MRLRSEGAPKTHPFRFVAITALMLLLPACSGNQVRPEAPPPPLQITPGDSAGAIAGIVSLEGNPLPGATVSLTQEATGGMSVAYSDVNGRYRFQGLSSGTYILRFEMESMQTVTRQVKIQGMTARVDAGLHLSSLAEAITVTAAAAPSALQSTAIRTTAPRFGALPEGGRYRPQPRPAQVSGGASHGVSGGTISGAPGFSAGFEDLDEYATIEENKFTPTAEEPVSTFSIDVDRASYSNVRRFLQSGALPPPDAVRIEEMVNYFDYGYPQPPPALPFAVRTEVAGCPWNSRHRLAHIALQARKIDHHNLPPGNLVFLIDVSGSMAEPDRLPLAQKLLTRFTDELRGQDSVAMVVYAGAAGVVLPAVSGAEKDRITNAIQQLSAGGSTAGGEGILLAYRIAQENFLPKGNNRVILATDGDFNVGVSSPRELEKLITEQRKKGIYLTVLGFGRGRLGDHQMETLADKGNGNYAYIDRLAEGVRVLVEEMGGTLHTVANDVKIQVDFDQALVSSYRLVGYENRALARQDFSDDTKDAGELGSGHSVTALYEIVPAAGAPAGKLGEINVRWKEPKESVSRLASFPLRDEGQSIWNASEPFRFSAAVAEFGLLLRNSSQRGEATYDDLMQLAKVAQGADVKGERAELLELIQSAKELTLKSAESAKQSGAP